MKRTAVVILLFLCVTMVSGCLTDFPDKKFGDQYFKTAVALIELHKTRFGDYPNSLDDLKYIGDWDRNALYFVKYKKLKDGYKLDLSGSWMKIVPKDLKYPKEFWKGLGLKSSNLKK